MSAELISVLNQLPLHVVLMIGIMVLWRDNQTLRKQIDEARQVTNSIHAMTLAQNTEISQIKAQTNGLDTKGHTISDV
jgi:hypothetical protein